MVSQVKFD